MTGDVENELREVRSLCENLISSSVQTASAIAEVIGLDPQEIQLSIGQSVVDQIKRLKTGAHVRVLDLPEAVTHISQLQQERGEAIARADIAEYMRDALTVRYRELEELLAGRDSSLADAPTRKN